MFDVLITLLGKALLILGSLFSLGNSGPAVHTPPTPLPQQNVATTSLASSTPTQTVSPKITQKTASTTKKISPTTPIKPPATSSSSSVPKIVEAPPLVTENTDWSALNTTVRQATVNILCTSPSGGSFNPVSGSGVLIGKDGVILTNAHVAQFLLLKDYGVECVARIGNPAAPSYTIDLLYISLDWVKVHINDLLRPDPSGTGENDFALIRITGPVGPSIQMPTTYPGLSLESVDDGIDVVGKPIIIVGYPAGFLGGASVQTNLYQSSAISSVKDVFTFDRATADLISLGASVLAQKGASGGAVAEGSGKSLGIVVTSSSAASTADRDLRAITTTYINRAFLKETGIALGAAASSERDNLISHFNTEALPSLHKLYEGILDKVAR